MVGLDVVGKPVGPSVNASTGVSLIIGTLALASKGGDVGRLDGNSNVGGFASPFLLSSAAEDETVSLFANIAPATTNTAAPIKSATLAMMMILSHSGAL